MTERSERLLHRLKTHGPQSAATLAAACAITPMGAHKQLQALAAQGLVSFHDEAGSVGRPRRIWTLTTAGHARFPDRHGELAAQLLRLAAAQWGPQALAQLISTREAEAEAQLQQRMAGLRSLPARLRALVQLRCADGYMARLERDGRDWLLVEDHCPICAAASQCQGFCRSELALFNRCLGPGVQVTREEHLLAGGRRCTYRVRSDA